MQVMWKEAVAAELRLYPSLLMRTEATHKQRKDNEEDNQQNALIVSLINLLISNYSNMFRPLS
jgi:hypothetical protein